MRHDRADRLSFAEKLAQVATRAGVPTSPVELLPDEDMDTLTPEDVERLSRVPGRLISREEQ